MGTKRTRSKLPQEEARRRYVEMGELAALEQIRTDSEKLDANAIAVGPFARLDAGGDALTGRRIQGIWRLEPERRLVDRTARGPGEAEQQGDAGAGGADPRPPTQPAAATARLAMTLIRCAR